MTRKYHDYSQETNHSTITNSNTSNKTFAQCFNNVILLPGSIFNILKHSQLLFLDIHKREVAQSVFLMNTAFSDCVPNDCKIAPFCIIFAKK